MLHQNSPIIVGLF